MVAWRWKINKSNRLKERNERIKYCKKLKKEVDSWSEHKKYVCYK